MNDDTIAQIILVVGGAAVLAGVFYSLLAKRTAQQNRASQVRVAADRLIDLVEKRIRIKLICGKAPNIALNNGEEILCVFQQTSLAEPRAIRIWRSIYGGPSFRIAKGVSFRFGESRGTSESHEEIRAVDDGTLILTNRRLIFIGSKRTINVPFEKIIDVDNDGHVDALRLNLQGRQRVEYFLFNCGLQMNYEYNGENLSTSLHAGLVKGAIDQAITFWRHPEAFVKVCSPGAQNSATASRSSSD